MKKAQSQFNLTKCLMNSSLSFTGLASFNFLTDELIQFLSSSIKQQLQKYILTTYSVHTLNKQVFSFIQNKKARFFIKIELFLELAVGFEPTTC